MQKRRNLTNLFWINFLSSETADIDITDGSSKNGAEKRRDQHKKVPIKKETKWRLKLFAFFITWAQTPKERGFMQGSETEFEHFSSCNPHDYSYCDNSSAFLEGNLTILAIRLIPIVLASSADLVTVLKKKNNV